MVVGRGEVGVWKTLEDSHRLWGAAVAFETAASGSWTTGVEPLLTASLNALLAGGHSRQCRSVNKSS